MKTYNKKVFTLLFSTLFLANNYTSLHPFHFGLDADIDFNFEHLDKEIEKLEQNVERSFKNFWKPQESHQAHSIQETKPSSLEQLWQKSSDWVRQLSKKLNTIADSMTTTQPKQTDSLRSYFDSARSLGEQTLQHIKKAEEQFSSLRKDIEQQIQSIKKVRSFDVKENIESSLYQVHITLPEFKQENINVTLDDNTRSTYKKLFITATKEVNNLTTKTTPKGEPANNAISTWRSESFTSIRYVNGRKVSLEYKDGKLEVEIDLPEGIKDLDYTMQLEHNELTIAFPTAASSAQPTTRKLQFNTASKESSNSTKIK